MYSVSAASSCIGISDILCILFQLPVAVYEFAIDLYILYQLLVAVYESV